VKSLKLIIVTFITLLLPISQTYANPVVAPDSTQAGPYSIASGEYHLPAAVYPDVLADRQTEMWASVFYPQSISSGDKVPLIILLHGNHGTCGTGTAPRLDYGCQYTDTGTCQAGYVPTPNHSGYDYLAKNLASWGYMVVSVNANRGITCSGGVEGDFGLNLARGRLVLKHLSYLYQWATVGGAPTTIGLSADGLIGKINFAEVGMLGHSRGGEGVRAAYTLYSDPNSAWPAKIPGLVVKGIFEIGAVDGQTSRTLDAVGTAWNQLLPMCDGDVSDLQGRFPFERMLLNPTEPRKAQLSLYEVWGANHNFFNTQWQTSDSNGCLTGKAIFNPSNIESIQQQTIALASVPAFFRSHVGMQIDSTLNQNFNPLSDLPAVVTAITQVDRDFTPSPGAGEIAIVENFDNVTGTNTSGNPNESSLITINHARPVINSGQITGAIVWPASSANTYFEAVITATGQGQDVHDYATLDFRVTRQNNAANTQPTTDFGIQLEDASNRFSRELKVSDYATLNGPGSNQPVLRSVRIPLSEFRDFDLSKIRGVRFVFDKTATGAIYLANIRFHRQFGYGLNPLPSMTKKTNDVANMENNLKVVPIITIPQNRNSIRSISLIAHSPVLLNQKPGVEIKIASEVFFPAMDTLPTLKIGKQEFKLSRYSDMASLKEMIFTLTMDQYHALQNDVAITMSDGKVWQFGTLNQWLSKHQIQQ
jgi:hypothetical protein